MATETFNVHTVTLPNECLRGVSIWSQQTREALTSGYHKVRVGIGRGADTDWLGTYDGREDRLAARVPVSLTGTTDVDRLLQKEDALIVEVTRFGFPVYSTAGLVVEFQMALVGGTSERPGALFSLGGFIPDARVRAAVETIPSQLNASGISTWTVSFQVMEPASGGWTPPTGTLVRTGYATSTGTLDNALQTLAALVTDLKARGII